MARKNWRTVQINETKTQEERSSVSGEDLRSGVSDGMRGFLPKGSWDERRRRIMEEGATGGQPREIGTDGG